MIDDYLNVVVQGVSLKEGMAGSMRVKNLVDPLIDDGLIKVSNLALTTIHETSKIGQKGVIGAIRYEYVGYKNPLNPIEVIKFYKAGITFLKGAFNKNSKNIIYNYGYPDIRNIVFLWYARSLGYKLIFDIVEDNRLDKQFEGLLSKFKAKSSIYFFNKIQTLANAVIAISSHLENRLKEVVTDTPIYLIPITVNFKYFPTTKSVTDPNNIKIFYGGSFYLGKDGIEFLIESFNEVSQKYSNVSLILSGMSAIKKDMEKVMGMIKGNPKIDYKGYLTTEQYYEVLNEADIFCMPRNNSPFAHAGFPFKLGEFLAAGKAIIATNVGDVSKYLENGKNALLINPESVKEISDSIIFCIENPEIVKKMGVEAKKTALKYFDSQILSKQVLEIFESV
jgi:glycosyltransferase involved in cell wall biosynthesis